MFKAATLSLVNCFFFYSNNGNRAKWGKNPTLTYFFCLLILSVCVFVAEINATAVLWLRKKHQGSVIATRPALCSVCYLFCFFK